MYQYFIFINSFNETSQDSLDTILPFANTDESAPIAIENLLGEYSSDRRLIENVFFQQGNIQILKIRGYDLAYSNYEKDQDINKFWNDLRNGNAHYDHNKPNHFIKLIDAFLESTTEERNEGEHIFYVAVHWGGNLTPPGHLALQTICQEYQKQFPEKNIKIYPSYYSVEKASELYNTIKETNNFDSFQTTFDKDFLMEQYNALSILEQQTQEIEMFLFHSLIRSNTQTINNERHLMYQKIHELIATKQANDTPKQVEIKLPKYKSNLNHDEIIIFLGVFHNSKGNSFVSIDEFNKTQKFHTIEKSSWEGFKDRLKNIFNKTNIILTDKKSDADLFIIFTPIKTLRKKDTFDNLGKLRNFITGDANKNISPVFKPIIFIGSFDIMCNYQREIEKNIFYKDFSNQSREFFKKKLKRDSRYLILDSNIWFRYIPISIFFDQELINHLNEINYFINTKLYESIVSKEFLEFQLRLLENAYIANVSTNSHHAKKVTPFQFHSETKLRLMADSYLDKLKDLSWNILLIDDYANDQLKTDEGIEGITELNKLEIISNLFRKDYFDLSTQTKLNLEIETKEGYLSITTATNLEDAEQAIRNKNIFYDIILLDYLLLNSDRSSSYGYEFIQLLEQIIEDENYDLNEFLGPLKELFIFPVTVYTNAMRESLRNLGITNNHFYWRILNGADPINTPQLFRYKLFTMMLNQQAGLVHSPRIQKKDTKKQSQLLYILESITKEVEGYSLNPYDYLDKTKTVEYYPDFVELGAKFKSLNKFKSKSQFAASMIKRYFFDMDIDTWEHLQHLFYLLTYGTYQQKTEMWEEAFFIERFILTQRNIFDTIYNNQNQLQEFQIFEDKIGLIRNYISNLKK